MQHPIVTVVKGNGDLAGELWDARAEIDVALMIQRYLAEHPPPPGAATAADLETWAHRLQADGQARLQELGAAHLRVA